LRDLFAWDTWILEDELNIIFQHSIGNSTGPVSLYPVQRLPAISSALGTRPSALVITNTLQLLIRKFDAINHAPHLDLDFA
jgi:hypothetical protein